jgi:hypothetical protein
MSRRIFQQIRNKTVRELHERKVEVKWSVFFVDIRFDDAANTEEHRILFFLP